MKTFKNLTDAWPWWIWRDNHGKYHIAFGRYQPKRSVGPFWRYPEAVRVMKLWTK